MYIYNNSIWCTYKLFIFQLWIHFIDYLILNLNILYTIYIIIYEYRIIYIYLIQFSTLYLNIAMQIMSRIFEYCFHLASLVKSKQKNIIPPKTSCNPTSPLVSQPWKCLSPTHLGGRFGGSRRFLNCIMPLKNMKMQMQLPKWSKMIQNLVPSNL